MSYYPRGIACNHQPTEPVTEAGVIVFYRCHCRRVTQTATGSLGSLETSSRNGGRSTTPYPLRLRQLER